MVGQRKRSEHRSLRLRVTAQDVAQRAGVSKSTVSIVFSGKRSRHVSADTQERVRAVAEEMGYVHSRLGRGFLQGQSRIVGLVVRLNPVVPWIDGVLAIHDELTRAGYIPLTLSPSTAAEPVPEADPVPLLPVSEGQCLRRLLEYQIDGLIFFALNPEQAEDIQPAVRRHGVPMVLVANRPHHLDVDFVAADEKKIGRVAARHLLSLGAKSFGVIEYRSDYASVQTRREAFVEELAKAGHSCRRLHLDIADPDSLRRQWPAGLTPPAALFAVDDAHAAVAVKAALAHGWRVPEDVAVIGMGNQGFTRNNTLPLASVSRNSADVGRTAVKLLLERINGYDGPPRRILIPPRLMVRESAMPVARRGETPGSEGPRRPRPSRGREG